MFRQIPSIRRRLAVLVAACIVPPVLFAVLLVVRSYDREQAMLKKEAIATARALSGALDRQFSSVQGAMLVLASSQLLRQSDLNAFHARASGLTQQLDLDGISLMGPDGHQLMNTRVPFGAPLPKDPPPQLLQAVRAAEPRISNLYTEPASGLLVAGMAVPVVDGQSATAPLVLNASFAPARLVTLLTQQRLAPNRITAILDATGTIVARTHEHEKYVGSKTRPGLIEAIAQDSEGTVESITLDGTPVVTAFSTSAQSRWTVVIGIPKAELAADLRQSLLLLLAGTGLVLLSGLALAWKHANGIANSIRELAHQADAMGRGERTAPGKADFREAAELGLVFQQTADKLDAAMARSEGRLNAVLESAMDAVMVVNETHRLVIFNAAAAALFGYSQAEAAGMSFDLLVPSGQGQGEWLRRAMQKQDTPQEDTAGLYALRRGGAEFPVDASVSTVKVGGTLSYVVIVRDVTRQLQARAALMRSNHDLQQFAFVASHDLRAPLRSIRGYLDLLQARHAASLNDKGRDLIQRATAATQQLDSLTDDLLSYASVDTQKTAMEFVDTQVIVRDCLQLLDASISQARADITVQQLPTVCGDEVQLRQLFQNLIGNAIKYCRADTPQISVQAQRADAGWTFSVADNGIGIEAEHQLRIFEIFKRLHTQQEYSGTGMGLAICQRIVQRHAGRIWVESKPGHGSTFFFTIPDPKEPT